MGNFKVEQMSDGKAIRCAEVQASSDVEAAKVWGPVTIPLGRERAKGEWIRVTHLASGRTSWFQIAGLTTVNADGLEKYPTSLGGED